MFVIHLRKEYSPNGKGDQKTIEDRNLRRIISSPPKGCRLFYVQHHGHIYRMLFLHKRHKTPKAKQERGA